MCWGPKYNIRYVIFNPNAHQQLTRINSSASIELLGVDTDVAPIAVMPNAF